MAGDWIKMRASLCTNPKVVMIAEIIAESTEIGRRLSTGFNGALSDIVTSDVTRDVTIASLLRVWCATNEHTDDGVWRNSTLRTIDQAAGIPGFGDAMAAAGWAIYDPEAGTVTMPNFLENNAPAKNNARSTAAERQARYRQRKRDEAGGGDVTRDATVTSQSDTREEKRREDTSSLRSDVQSRADGLPAEFLAAWEAYPQRAGGDSRKAALKAWQARVRAGVEPAVILAGVQRYAAYVKATGKLGTEYVKQAATFFGPAEHYLLPFNPPAARTTHDLSSMDYTRGIGDDGQF